MKGTILRLLILAYTTIAPALQAQFTYATNSDNVSLTITGYSGSGGSVIVPSNINNLSVTVISNFAFALKTSITSVTVPASVTNIGGGAFGQCTNLASATLPGNITQFQAIFEGCPKLSTLIIANGVTSIMSATFENCTGLTSLTIPEGVTNIGGNAFYGCSSLTSVTIPDSVTSIGGGAFAYCSGLASVYFNGNAPQTPEGFEAFPDDSAIVYYFPGTTGWNPTFCGLPTQPFPFNFTTNFGAITITAYIGTGGNVIIPEYIYGLLVTSIGSNAFYQCTNLTSVVIPNSIMTLGGEAFMLCPNLVNVTLPGSIGMGDNTFSYCTNLAGVYCMGSSPLPIFQNAFTSDTNATMYYLYGSSGWAPTFESLPTVKTAYPGFFTYITNNGAIAITGCESISGPLVVPFAINGLSVASVAFSSFVGASSLTIPGTVLDVGLVGGPTFTNVTIINGVQSIGSNAFSGAGVTSFAIPPSVTNIGANAFENCPNLANVTIPASMTNFGNMFYQCPKLTNATLEYGAVKIGQLTFAGASPSLISVNLPSSVTNIIPTAFNGNPSLKAINVDTNNSFYSSLSGVLFDSTHTKLIEFPEGLGGNYTIPASVTDIATWAFNDCLTLTNIIIPSSVTNFESAAILECWTLKGIYFMGNAPSNSSSLAFVENPVVYYLPGTTGWPDFSASSGVPAVLWNPLIETNDGRFGVQNNQFGFSITGTTNYMVVVEACTNLVNPVWTPLQTVALTNGSYYFADPQWTNHPNCFYALGPP